MRDRYYLQCQVFIPGLLIFGLLLQSCRATLYAVIEEAHSKGPYKTNGDAQGNGEARVVALGTQFHSPSAAHSGAHRCRFSSGCSVFPSSMQQGAVLSAAVRGVAMASQRRFSDCATQIGCASPTRVVGVLVSQPSPRLLTASSGERLLLSKQGNHWQALLQHGIGSRACQHTVPVVSSEDIDALLVGLRDQDIWASRSRVHVMASPYPPHGPCVYLGKIGLLGGAPTQQALLGPEKSWLPGLSMTLDRSETCTKVFHIRPGCRYEQYRLKPNSVIQRANFTIRYVASNSEKEISGLQGIVDDDSLEAKLTEDFDTVLTLWRFEGGSCKTDIKNHQGLPELPFKHEALVVHGSTKGVGLFGQRSRIDVQLEFCVVQDKDSTSSRELLPNPSNSTPFPCPLAEEWVDLETSQVRRRRARDEELSEEDHQEVSLNQSDATAQLQAEVWGIEKLQATSSFGVQAWKHYFGEVGEEPLLPSNIDAILESPCPFWPRKQVRDTHVLVLVPARVCGQPFTLDLLGKLVRSPQGRGYGAKYRAYKGTVQIELGGRSADRSYWVMMTRDVLPGSRNKLYEDQEALVAAYALRTGLPYELPQALEAATVILLHYTRTGECLYTDDPWTFTRCQEKVDAGRCPVVVGGFSSGGLVVHDSHKRVRGGSGVSCLRRF